MFAAVDLGSNSFRLHIGRYEDGVIRVIKSAREPIRLAASLDADGYLSAPALAAAIESMARFGTILRAYSLTAVRVVATSTLRVAKNAQDFIPAAERAIGYPIDIISGQEEGRLIYMGVAHALALPDQKRLVIDIGGGSTEMILGRGAEIEHVESFGIGNVNQSLAFFKHGVIDDKAFEQAILSARSHVEDAILPFSRQYWSHAYGSSGTVRAIADVLIKNNLGDGRVTLHSLEAMKQYLIACGNVNRIALLGLKTERAAVIMGGLSVLIGLMQELKIEVIAPVDAGLRLGVMWDLQLRATKRDRREESVQAFATRLQVDRQRARQVVVAAADFYERLKPAAATYTKHVQWSALLHESGLMVAPSAYHKHSSYLVAHADLPGFTTREQRVMSMLVLGQRGNLRKLGSLLEDPDFAKALLALRLAVMFMHAHIALEPNGFNPLRLKMKSRIELEIDRNWLAEHPTVAYWMQKEQEWWRDVGVEFVLL